MQTKKELKGKNEWASERMEEHKWINENDLKWV